MKPKSFFKDKINSWDEICLDDSKRLRTNVVIFSFFASCVFLVMFIVRALIFKRFMEPQFVILTCISLIVFFVQFLSKKYLYPVAWLFGFMALSLTYFLFDTFNAPYFYTFIWVYLIPIIGIIVVPFTQSLIFNILLLAILNYQIRTGGPSQIPDDGGIFQALFTISLVFEIICIYMIDHIRFKTHSRLRETTIELRSFAFIDPLTGVYNRHAFRSHFHSEDAPSFGLSVCMIDIDFFKKVNDQYGHDIGDQILLHIASIIKNSVPPNANVYRWGGEEFVVILKTSDKNSSEALFEMIRANCEKQIYSENNLEIPVTVSLGGATGAVDLTLHDCIKLADDLLYEAKGSGRNKLVFHY